MLHSGRVNMAPSSRNWKALQGRSLLWGFGLFILGLLAGPPLQLIYAPFARSTGESYSSPSGNVYHSGLSSRGGSGSGLEDMGTADLELRDSLGELQDKLSTTLESIAAKQALLNATLEETEVARKRLIEVVYVAEEPLPPHLAVKGPLLDGMAAKTAKMAGVSPDSVKSVNFSAAVEERLTAELEVRMPLCVALLCMCEEAQKKVGMRRQLYAQELREYELFKWVKEACRRLDTLDPWFLTQGLTLEEAQERVRAGEGDEQLEKYLYYRTLYYQYWDNRTDETHLALITGLVDEKEAKFEEAQKEFSHAQLEFETCKGHLRTNCSWTLPRDKWREDHDEIIANHTKRRAENGTILGGCTDGGTPEERAALGLAAPYELWRRDPELYPDRVNITFVMQYYKRPEVMKTIVDRLWACTNGILGKGQLPGVTSQLVVNVDQPEEMGKWIELWHETKEGEFLIPIFSHEIGSLQAFNNGGRVAKGYVVAFMHDDEIPPESCSWINNALSAFQAWPRLGAIGMSYGQLSTEQPGVQRHARAIRQSDDATQMRMQDPKSKVRMQFSSVIGFTPAVVRRKFFVDMGGFDEGLPATEGLMGVEGEDTPIMDRHMSIRMWLAGYQVAHMHMREAFQKHTDKGGEDQSRRGADRKKRQFDERAYMKSVGGYEGRVNEEVKRMNALLDVVDPWGEATLINP